MSGMYPNNQDIEIFGEQVKWPGVDANGKFTNGDFSDPMVKPSFIPAETINLILDNLSSIIKKCGVEPNATGAAQIADLLTHLSTEKTIIMRDGHGRAKVAAPQEPEDIARLAEIDAIKTLLKTTSYSPEGYGLYSEGRNILDVLNVSTIPEAMAEIRRRLNNNGEIDATGIPDFSGLMIGDYIDGIDFNGTTAPTNGTAPQAWNDTYKNNRIVIAGFNTYKNMGSTENGKNHVTFVFKNIIAKARMNATDTNTGGYPSSEMRVWLEGANGDGSGVLATKLKQQLGGDYLYKISKVFPIESGGSSFYNCSLFIPTELEIFGIPLYGTEGAYENGKRSGYSTAIQLPIYQKSYVYRIKRWNGSRDWYFMATPLFGSSAAFTRVSGNGDSSSNNASLVGGCAPAFCVA